MATLSAPAPTISSATSDSTPSTLIRPSVISAAPALGDYTAAKTQFNNTILPAVTAGQATTKAPAAVTPDGTAGGSGTGTTTAPTSDATDLSGIQDQIKGLTDLISGLGDDGSEEGSSGSDSSAPPASKPVSPTNPDGTPAAAPAGSYTYKASVPGSSTYNVTDSTGRVVGTTQTLPPAQAVGNLIYQAQPDGTYAVTDQSGNPVGTSQTLGGAATPAAGSSSDSANSTAAPGASTDSDMVTALNANAAQQTQAYQDYKSQLNSISTGSIPLTPGQQAQVDGANAQLDQAIATQNAANANYVKAVQIIGAERGNSMYEPEVQADDISNAITTGVQKVQKIQADATAAIAKMESSFQTDDYSAAKDAYTAYSGLLEKQATEITSMQKAIDTHLNQLQENNTKVALAKIADVAKSITLSLQQKVDAVNALVKSGNLTLAEKKQAVTQVQAQQRINISAQAQNLRSYVAQHPNEKTSIVGGTLDDAFSAIQAGADPAAVKAQFLSVFPDASKAWDDYAAGKKPGGTNAAGTGGSTSSASSTDATANPFQ